MSTRYLTLEWQSLLEFLTDFRHSSFYLKRTIVYWVETLKTRGHLSPMMRHYLMKVWRWCYKYSIWKLVRGVWRAHASYKLEAYPLSLYASFLDKILQTNDWDSGSTKVAKMGVHTSDQWRNNLYFFPNYCVLLSSISLQNMIVRYFFHIFLQGFIKQWNDRDSARSFCATTTSFYPVS